MSLNYLFDTEEGKLYRENPGKEKKNLSGNYCEISLLSLDEFKSLQGDYPHKRNLYRGMSPVQYCKIETFTECIQGTMKVPRGSKEKISMQAFGFYLQEERLILIEEGRLLKTLLGKIETNTYGKCRINQLLLILLETLIEDDVLYLQQQEDKLSAIEEGLLEKIPEHFYENIILYRKQFSAYHSYYEQLVNIGDQMQGDFGQKLTLEERSAWQLYANRAERLHNHVEMLREYLVQIRELYQALIDVQQNKVMSILTVVTTIFLPLTLIAGWYGMNFPSMPEFHWKYAYPVIILISIVIIVGEILFFRKKKML